MMQWPQIEAVCFVAALFWSCVDHKKVEVIVKRRRKNLFYVGESYWWNKFRSRITCKSNRVLEGKYKAVIRLNISQRNNENATPREATEVLEAGAFSITKANEMELKEKCIITYKWKTSRFWNNLINHW